MRQLEGLVSELLVEHRLQLNRPEQDDLVYQIVDDMVGLGPLEPLLEDETITDIMVNGPNQVYVERKGKVELTDVDVPRRRPLLNIGNRIVTEVGRRVDESTPTGRRPPARTAAASTSSSRRSPSTAPSISIRKFSKKADHARRDGAPGQHLGRHGDGAEDRRARAGSTS